MKSINFFVGITFLAIAVSSTAQTPCSSPTKSIQPVFTAENASLPAISHEGNRVVVIPRVGTTRIFDLLHKGEAYDLDVTDSDGYAISSDGKRVAIFGGKSGANTVSIYDVESRKELFNGSTMIRRDGMIANLQVNSHAGQLSRNISGDLRLVAIAPAKILGMARPLPSVVVGDLNTLEVVREVQFGETLVKDFWEQEALTPDGSLLAASRHNIDRPERSVTVVWNVDSGKERLRLPFSSEWLVLADNGCCIVTRRRLEKGVATEAWNLNSGKLIARLKDACSRNSIRMTAAAISPDGKILATAGTDHLLLWNIHTGTLAASAQVSDSQSVLVKAVAFSGNGEYIAVGLDGEEVKVWRTTELLLPIKERIAFAQRTTSSPKPVNHVG